MLFRKTTWVFLLVVCFLASGFAYSVSRPPKNLKVLPRDISDAALDSIMHTYNTALGVKCNFCHVKEKNSDRMDFASDDNPSKDVARDMIRLNIDINKKYFNVDSTVHPAYLNTVTCNTCHRGSAFPEQ